MLIKLYACAITELLNWGDCHLDSVDQYNFYLDKIVGKYLPSNFMLWIPYFVTYACNCVVVYIECKRKYTTSPKQEAKLLKSVILT